jgi:SAM-dependent methyltransferase
VTRSGFKINVGSGNEPLDGYVNVDRRRVPGVQAIGDVLHLPFAAGSADEVSALSLLEHFEDPYVVLDELTRVLHDRGRFVMLVPSPWSQSGLLDKTHVFLADLKQWTLILQGYFDRVSVSPEGVRYRYNKPMVAIQYGLIHGLRLFEFAQAWSFHCTGKKRERTRAYIPWWLEDRYGQQKL